MCFITHFLFYLIYFILFCISPFIFQNFIFIWRKRMYRADKNLPHRLHSADSAADICDSMRNYIR